MSSVDPAEHQWNCLNCKRRKVRCDRHYPCANCVKGQRDCIFPTSGRVFRRAESRIDPSRPRAKQAELMSRIRRLENVVDGLNTELESRSVPSGRSTPRSSPSHGLVSDTNSSHGVAAALSNPDVPIQNDSIPSLGLSPDPDLQPEPFRGPLQVAPPEERGSVYVGDHFWASLRREVSLYTQRRQATSAMVALTFSRSNSSARRSMTSTMTTRTSIRCVNRVFCLPVGAPLPAIPVLSLATAGIEMET